MVIFFSDTQTVVVRSPDLGDTETVPLRVRLHRAMDGTLWSYKLGTSARVVALKFRYLTRDKIVELFEFFKSNAGKVIRYNDYEGQEHSCRVLPSDLDSEDVGRENSTFDVELEYV